MPSNRKLAGLLAERIDRLRGAFAALHRSVRERVAEIVGTTVADVVRQTVRAALDTPAPPTPIAPAVRRAAYDAWAGPETDDWADDRDVIGDDGPHAWDNPAPAAPIQSCTPTGSHEPARPPRLAAAVAVGLKAAAWWLATRPVRRGWGCVLAGLAAGGAAYALGPAAAVAAPAVAALALVARSAELVNPLPT